MCEWENVAAAEHCCTLCSSAAAAAAVVSAAAAGAKMCRKTAEGRAEKCSKNQQIQFLYFFLNVRICSTRGLNIYCTSTFQQLQEPEIGQFRASVRPSRAFFVQQPSPAKNPLTKRSEREAALTTKRRTEKQRESGEGHFPFPMRSVTGIGESGKNTVALLFSF